MNDTLERQVEEFLEKDQLGKAIKIIGARDNIISYELAVRVMARYATSRTSKNIRPFAARHLQGVRKLMDQLNTPEQRKKRILANSIYTNTLYPLMPWREKLLAQYDDQEQIRQWVSVDGLDILNDAYESGNGIVLVNSHLSTGRLATWLLGQMDYEIYSLETENRLADYGVRDAEKINVLRLDEKQAFPLKELYQARKLLKEGKIVNVSGDGPQGNSGISTEFLGRNWKFKPSFAELAVSSGATAIPVIGYTGLGGKCSIIFNKPFDAGDDEMTHDEKIQHLVQQYAQLLETCWKRMTGNLAWQQIGEYFTLPPYDDQGQAKAKTA